MRTRKYDVAKGNEAGERGTATRRYLQFRVPASRAVVEGPVSANAPGAGAAPRPGTLQRVG